MKIAIVGLGKMGSAVESVARARGHDVVARFDRSRPVGPQSELAGAEVAFEFTRPDAAEANVRALLERGVAVVSGTTGWEPSASLLEATGRAGLIVAPNFSIGVHAFVALARRAAELMAPLSGYDAWIVEAHHRGKADAPSGTARRIARVVQDADPRYTRVVEDRPVTPLERGDLQVLSLRSGAEPGTHVLGFDGAHDRIELRHHARGRTGFAEGAVLAAEWLRGRRGRHELEAVTEALLRPDREER